MRPILGPVCPKARTAGPQSHDGEHILCNAEENLWARGVVASGLSLAPVTSGTQTANTPAGFSAVAVG